VNSKYEYITHCNIISFIHIFFILICLYIYIKERSNDEWDVLKVHVNDTSLSDLPLSIASWDIEPPHDQNTTYDHIISDSWKDITFKSDDGPIDKCTIDTISCDATSGKVLE
jgi:hypothetical protein